MNKTLALSVFLLSSLIVFILPVHAVTYTYDELSRLKETNYGNIKAFYEYDANGNILNIRYESDGLPGDVNIDGSVDLQDALLVLRVLAGITVSPPLSLVADVNNDQKIGMENAIYILQVVARLRN